MDRAKRKRVVLPISEKIDIIHALDDGVSVKSLAEKYNIGSSTIRDLIRNRESIICFFADELRIKGTSSRKTMKATENKKIDTELFNWYTSRRTEGFKPTSMDLCKQALKINSDYSINPDFKAGNSWLRSFKKRYGVKENRKVNSEDSTKAFDEDPMDYVSQVNGQDQEPCVSHSEAIECFEKILSWMDHQSECDVVHKFTVKHLQNLAVQKQTISLSEDKSSL